MVNSKTRIERDTLGEVAVPSDAYFGAQTQRAIDNFRVSNFRLQPVFLWAQAVIKQAAAKANLDSGKLDKAISKAIIKAAGEIIAGKYRDQFVVDVFQAGAGTSQNMNINEVIANRANEILGTKIGEYKPIHPNDHVNMGQSTNDTFHSAIHIAAYTEIIRHLLPSIERLSNALQDKSQEFNDVIKIGRTHLQDAVPIRLGQEFGAYASMIKADYRRIKHSSKALLELAIGGSAVGTGLNTYPGYRENIIKYINESTGYKFTSANNMFKAMQSFDSVVGLAGALRVLTTNLHKIANDFRLLSSGPRAGISEIKLPAVQPGSSIMPGKINPVMAEMLNMVCFQALGCDAVIVQAARAGQLELNVMMPVIAYNLLMEIEILHGCIKGFIDRCVVGIKANIENCRKYAERSLALAAALNPYIGYNKAAEIAKEAFEKNLTIRELVIKKKLLSESQLDIILDIRKMTED
jgi:fumarate hydratase class II